MTHGPRKRVPFRRRREGRTDFRFRKRLILSEKPRACVRLSLEGVSVQFIDFEFVGDRTLAAATSGDIRKLGWTASGDSTPAAYLVGFLAGKRAVKAGVGEAVLDIGRRTPTKGARVFAALKGIVDAGVKVPHDKAILPAADRINGKHLKVTAVDQLVASVKRACDSAPETRKEWRAAAPAGGRADA
ncbi:MAG TPA: 50S ribosomal protein L18 [Thermoplasmata archaeon]|nr:50S ribosomal protein L18 [Thermoplasmata archaeon]